MGHWFHLVMENHGEENEAITQYLPHSFCSFIVRNTSLIGPFFFFFDLMCVLLCFVFSEHENCTSAGHETSLQNIMVNNCQP